MAGSIASLDQSFLQGVAAGQTPVDPNLIQGAAQNGLTPSAVNTLLGFQNDITQAQTDETVAQAAVDKDNTAANGYALQQTGYNQEATAYGTAAQIASSNANLAYISGDIAAAQEQRQITRTLGSQQADIAGAGFNAGNSGSALYLYADSAMQGNLATSLTKTNAALEAGGFQQASAAADAEASAAGVASSGAGTAASEADIAANTDAAAWRLAAQQGTSAQTNMTNLVSALMRTGQGANATGAASMNFATPLATPNPLATVALTGHTGAGMLPDAMVGTGGAPQSPSPFLTNPGGTIGTVGGTPIANATIKGGMDANFGTV